ncbi:membrane protein insertase YidC [Planctomonas psychrotolerans]|uniref:membrane protein insertase YidC n=1 Tax=Planctomonas psychrotolerans TaxID=2528712 RepID=UPI00123A607D|nr:membrane protein insertase YidC [Planctomonas psychrotolerans]
MDFYSFAPIAAVLDGAYFLLDSLRALLDPLAGSASAALAVVLLTVLVRAMLTPVGVSQVRAEFSRRRLAPHLRELQNRYRTNPEMLRRTMQELYAREKASPVAGCLPTLAQAPVLSVVYGLFVLHSINGHANALLTEQLCGVALGDSLIAAIAGGIAAPGAALFAGVLGGIAVVAWLSRRVALRQAALFPQSAPSPPGTPDLSGMTNALSWMPFITVGIAAIVPLAAGIYLAVTTAWTLAERSALRAMLGARAG